MAEGAVSKGGIHWFTALKYTTYALLMLNVYLFLDEELTALEHTFGMDVSLGDLIQAFAATIDTTAWVLLLLLFELETFVIPDEKIKGVTRWLLHGIRIICYGFISYAFTGYLSELGTLYQVVPMPAAEVCANAGQGWFLLVDMDKYLELGGSECADIGNQLQRLRGFNIVAQAEVLQAVRLLAWTDVINSAAWLLVVLVLEIDVRLQLRGHGGDWLTQVNRVIKLFLYNTLLIAAVYWGFKGSLLDFWDAFLWLFAFVFIELNVFDWQAEVEAGAADAVEVSA